MANGKIFTMINDAIRSGNHITVLVQIYKSYTFCVFFFFEFPNENDTTVVPSSLLLLHIN